MFSKRKRYKLDMEEGTSTPRSTRYYRAKENKSSDDETSSNDKEKFYKLVGEKYKGQESSTTRSNQSEDRLSTSSYNSSLRDELRNFNVNHNVNKYCNEEYEMDNYDTPTSFDNRLDEFSFDSLSASLNGFYECFVNNSSDDDSEIEDDFWAAIEEEKCSELQQQLSSGDLDEPIISKVVATKAEMLYAINKFSDHYSIPVIGIESLCRMINGFLSSPVLPYSRYNLDKLLRSNNCVQFHAICPICTIYLRQFDRKEKTVYCEKCKTDVLVKGNNINFFVIFKVEDKIKNLLMKNEVYDTLFKNVHEQVSEFNDIYDGLKYKEFIKSLPDEQRESCVTCIFNSDGSPVFKSSTFSIWPIQILLNELPIETRYEETITCGLWFGQNKPKMQLFLKSFVDYFNDLNVHGILCKINKTIKAIRVYPICSCVDTIARAPMQGMIQFNGRYGCNWCYHPGKLVKSKTKKIIKYPLLDEIPPLRRAEETALHMQTKQTSMQPVFGVKESSALISLEKFDIIDGFVPDPMHCIFLGICRQFAHYWFDERRKPYSLNKRIAEIDNILKSIKVPIQIARLPRSLKDRKYWKSREWENWLFYYSLPILKIMPNFRPYREHWELLVQAIHILMKESIPEANLIQGDMLLKEFVASTEKLYSKAAMTYNIHQLLHLSQSVANWGPLWSHSGYPFESGNGQIVRIVKAAKGVLHQICRNVEYRNSAIILERHIKEKYKESQVSDFIFFLENKCTDKSLKIMANRYFGKCFATNKHWISLQQLSETSTRSYHRMLKSNSLLTSYKKKTLKSSNCFAITKHGVYIRIIEFIVDEKNQKEYTLCNFIEIENSFNYCTEIKRIVKINESEMIIATFDIAIVTVCLDVVENQYIIALPNKLKY